MLRTPFRILFALLVLSLLTCDKKHCLHCAEASDGVTVTESILQACDSTYQTGCKKRQLRIMIKVANTVPANEKNTAYIYTATDAESHNTIVSIDQLKLELTRSLTSYRYSMRYVRDFNANPSEKPAQSGYCIQEGDLWYAGYTLGNALTFYTVDMQLTNLSSSTEVTTVHLDTSVHSITTNTYTTISYPGYSPQLENFGDKMLFIPVRPANSEAVKAGPSEYMILPNSMITLDGSECGKVGIGYTDPSDNNEQCHFTTDLNCVANQISSLRDMDEQRIKGGSTPLYLASLYGDVEGIETLNSADYLSYIVPPPESFTILLVLNADDLSYQTAYSTGSIVSAAMSSASALNSYQDPPFSIQVKNDGDTVATYKMQLDSCSKGVQPFAAQQFNLNRNATTTLHFYPSYDAAVLAAVPAVTVQCEVSLWNALDHLQAKSTVEWIPILTPTNSGGTSTSNTGSSSSSSSASSEDSCAACSIVNLLCAFRHRCTYRIVGAVGVLVATLAVVAVTLWCLRGVLCRFCCCCCSSANSKYGRRHSRRTTGSSDDERSSNESLTREKTTSTDTLKRLRSSPSPSEPFAGEEPSPFSRAETLAYPQTSTSPPIPTSVPVTLTTDPYHLSHRSRMVESGGSGQNVAVVSLSLRGSERRPTVV